MALSNSPAAATVPASDFARAKAFYADTLGLKLSEDMEYGALYECGMGSKIFLYQSAFAGTNKATAVTFNVEDVEAEMAALRDKGVVFEEYDLPELKTNNGLAVDGGMKSAWFKDTEGNILNISQKE